MKSGGILGMDNTEIRRRRRNRRRVRNIRVGLTLFTICIVAIAIPVVRGILRKPAQITIQVADVEIKQGEQLPAYSADIKIREKEYYIFKQSGCEYRRNVCDHCEIKFQY